MFKRKKIDSLILFKLPKELGTVENICKIEGIKIIVLPLKLFCLLVLLLWHLNQLMEHKYFSELKYTMKREYFTLRHLNVYCNTFFQKHTCK